MLCNFWILDDILKGKWEIIRVNIWDKVKLQTFVLYFQI
jgi:hypothetical protein